MKYIIIQHFDSNDSQGQIWWGKFICFYVLTSEIDNLSNIKINPNYAFFVGNAYVCKLADIENKRIHK